MRASASDVHLYYIIYLQYLTEEVDDAVFQLSMTDPMLGAAPQVAPIREQHEALMSSVPFVLSESRKLNTPDQVLEQ